MKRIEQQVLSRIQETASASSLDKAKFLISLKLPGWTSLKGSKPRIAGSKTHKQSWNETKSHLGKMGFSVSDDDPYMQFKKDKIVLTYDSGSSSRKPQIWVSALPSLKTKNLLSTIKEALEYFKPKITQDDDGKDAISIVVKGTLNQPLIQIVWAINNALGTKINAKVVQAKNEKGYMYSTDTPEGESIHIQIDWDIPKAGYQEVFISFN